jgi:thioesterase domain-containing protein/acyl carrier protein
LPETPLEQALAQIWRELLEVEQVGALDSFFDLGGDSLLASALMARIEAAFARRLAPVVLMQHPTLRALAACLAAETAAESHELLVSIRPQGELPPVFFFPGMGGSLLALRDLLAGLEVKRPLYGLHLVDFGSPAAIKPIEQAAEEYEKVVRSVWPHGGCILVGYSFGGHLALETARCLAAGGEVPPLVILLDTHPPLPARPARLSERLRFHYRNLRGLQSTGQVGEYLRGRLQRIYLRLVRFQGTRAFAQRLPAPDRSPNSAAQIALVLYHPQPYTGQVVLLTASQHLALEANDLMDGWLPLMRGEFSVRALPGSHFSMLRPPYSLELVRQLRELLG